MELSFILSVNNEERWVALWREPPRDRPTWLVCDPDNEAAKGVGTSLDGTVSAALFAAYRLRDAAFFQSGTIVSLAAGPFQLNLRRLDPAPGWAGEPAWEPISDLLLPRDCDATIDPILWKWWRSTAAVTCSHPAFGTPAVQRLLAAMQHGRDWSGMPAVADALEGAGYVAPAVLDGMRARSPWCVSLVRSAFLFFAFFDLPA